MSAAVRSEIFREVNERIARITGAWEWNSMQGFLCECAGNECVQSVTLTRSEYESVRSGAGRFLMVSGHDHVDEDRILENHTEFVVVEKLGSFEAVSAPSSGASTETRPPPS